MRIHIRTTPNVKTVPFEYQKNLVGTLNKWIGGDNDEHGKMSLYSFSWLKNGKRAGEGLDFSNGARWFVSCYNEALLKRVLRNIIDSPEMFAGMTVTDVTIEKTPDLTGRNLFYLGSPVFIKTIDQYTKEARQLTYDDNDSGAAMVNTMRRKMEMAGLPADDTLSIRFDMTYGGRKTKMITYRGIGNRANMCPVIIDGRPETKAFAWEVGIGNSTGIGFGSIY